MRVRRLGVAANMARPFAELQRVARVMEDFSRAWFVAGGWAIDLFLGRETRAHEDVEIAVLRADQEEMRRHLAGWTFEKVVSGVREPWREGERLEPPIHEIHASSPGGESLEILLNEAAGDVWRFRRNPAVTRPLSEVGLRAKDGVLFLAPEIVLLYKAKVRRTRDERDFEGVLPAMDGGRRAWLAGAIAASHPAHPWIARLREDDPASS
jgi:hypothetical protein